MMMHLSWYTLFHCTFLASKNDQGQNISCITRCAPPRCTSLVFLKCSGTNANECGSLCTTSSYIYWGTGKYFSMYTKTVRNELYMIYQNIFLNQSVIFINALGPSQILWTFQKKIFLSAHQTQKSPCLSQKFFCLFFSSSGTHQSHHLDGCQATRINVFLICAF